MVYATVPELKATERKLQTNIDNHIRDAARHVSDQERTRWNGKADLSHRHKVADIDGLPEKIDEVTKSKAEKVDLTAHIQNKNNPHNVTKQQVGLGNVTNVEQASKQDFNNHTTNRNNPHGVTKHQVGLGNVDNVRQASYESVEALKREFQEHEDRLNAIEYMFLQNDFTAPIRTEDSTEHTLLADEDGHVIVADWKYRLEI